jgi:hypothetical protein
MWRYGLNTYKFYKKTLFLTYLPRIGLCSLLPVCVHVTMFVCLPLSLLGSRVTRRIDLSVQVLCLSRAADLLLSLRWRLNIFSVECLHNTSDQTKEETRNITSKRLLFSPRHMHLIEMGSPL